MLSQLHYKFLAAAIFILFFSGIAHAQLTEKISFTLPSHKVTNSLYNKISFVDSRIDTTNMGIVQKGAFNRQAIVIAKESLAIQFNNILSALIDSSSKSQELLLQLRQLSFAEITKSFSEKGYFYLHAILYAKTNMGYQKISETDTLTTISAMDVTNGLLKKGSETISNFIASNLDKKPLGTTVYSYNEIVKIDSTEKSNLKVYTTTTYKDGLYLTYKSFCNQIPDAQITVTGDTVTKSNVKFTDKTGELKKLKAGNAYAIVYKGKPYIITSFDYYPLKKIDNDFFFTGKISVKPKSDLVNPAMYSAVGGAIGGLIMASNSETTTAEVKINYINGDFIKMKEVNK